MPLFGLARRFTGGRFTACTAALRSNRDSVFFGFIFGGV